MLKFFIASTIGLAVLAIWALGQLSIERAASRMVDEWRENDRKFYRGWENVWFKQLERIAPGPAEKPKAKQPTKGRKANNGGKNVST